MTKRQAWAIKRNWLIMRLMGARSIFSYDNTTFMGNATNMNQTPIHRCEDALNELIKVMRRTTYKELK